MDSDRLTIEANPAEGDVYDHYPRGFARYFLKKTIG
jgi:hypothetical protein